MYAIIENGGKQYKAIEGKFIEIDLLSDEVGKKKSFENILLLSTDEKVEIGEPFLKGVSVDGTILAHFKGPKLTIFKYRAKQRFRVKTGHRQNYTRVQIDSIAFPGKAEVVKKDEETPVVEKAAAPKKVASAKKPAVKKPAVKKPAAAKPKSVTKKPTTKKPAAAKKTSADKK